MSVLKFSDPKVVKVFESAYSRVSDRIVVGQVEPSFDFFIRFIGEVLYAIYNYPDQFDEGCSYNSEAIGDKFISRVESFNVDDSEHVQVLYGTCYRFFVECQLTSRSPMPHSLVRVAEQVHLVSYEHYTEALRVVRWADHQMMIEVVRRFIHHPNMAELKDLPARLKLAADAKVEADTDLTEREARVEALKGKLDTYKTGFNFVALYDGFKSMRNVKSRERHLNFGFLFFLGIALIFPFFINIYFLVFPREGLVLDYRYYVGSLGFELLLIYFFRVCLHNFRAVKAQLLQIDLRMALCQFVQDYASYAKEIKAGDADLLVRFEQVVFSGIVNSDEAIPSTFDGFEQVGKLVSSLRK